MDDAQLGWVIASQRALDAAVGVQTPHHSPEFDRRGASRAVVWSAGDTFGHQVERPYLYDDGAALPKTVPKSRALRHLTMPARGQLNYAHLLPPFFPVPTPGT
jgi:hypothetical protein